MAINVTNLLVGSGSGTDPATASISPAADALVLLSLNLYVASGAVSAPSSVTGNGITYALIASAGDQDPSPDGNNQYLYRGMSASPSAGGITISGTWDYVGWTVDQVTGVLSGSNGANAVVQSATNFSDTGVTSATVTLAAFASSNNGAYGMIDASGEACAPGGGWTELVDNSAIGQHQTQWRADNDTTCDWTFSSTFYGAIAIELAAVASAGAPRAHYFNSIRASQ